MALLDTNVLVDLMRRPDSLVHKRAAAAVKALGPDEPLCTSRINVAELYVGVELARDREAERIAVGRALGNLLILDFEDDAARIFAAITAELRRAGRPSGDMDILIAAIAVNHGQSIITRNPRHFLGFGRLRVISY